MKTIHERELEIKTIKEKQKRQKGARRTEAIVKVWELNNFVLHLI